MELFLLKLVAVFRPIGSIEYSGEGLFDLVGIGLFGVMVVALLANRALQKSPSLTGIDLLIAAFSVWCVAVYLIYFEVSVLRDVAKLLIPPISYVVTKNIVRDREQYRRLIFWMIAGFLVPAALSLFLIVSGQGVDYQSIWTGIIRWRGAYTGSHTLAHSMTFLLFAITIYVHMSRPIDSGESSSRLGKAPMAALTALAATALWCLYMSQTRSAILGLLVFSAIYFFWLNKKYFILAVFGIAVVGLALLPVWLPVLFPDVVMYKKGQIEATGLGSDRPQYWAYTIELYKNLPIDQQLAGIGIGNVGPVSTEGAIDAHNDWLNLINQTGAVGFVLFLVLQIAIGRTILRLHEHDRYLFLGLFVAVNIMMFVSNSYIFRIAVSQLYYMALAFIEVRPSAIAPTQS